MYDNCRVFYVSIHVCELQVMPYCYSCVQYLSSDVHYINKYLLNSGRVANDCCSSSVMSVFTNLFKRFE